MESQQTISQHFFRRLCWLAVVIGLVTATAVPCFYVILGYRDREFHAELHAELLVQNLQRSIRENPKLWQYDIPRYIENAHRLPHFDTVVAISVYDESGTEQFEHRYGVASHAITVRVPVIYLGQIYGWLEIMEAMDSFYQSAALLTAAFSLVGFLFALVIYRYPKKIILSVEKRIFSTWENLQVSQRTLREMTVRDTRTQLFNADYVGHKLEEEVEKLERLGGRLCVLVLDIDHFRKYNEAFGHMAGNTLLRAMAFVLAGQVRPQDTLGRLGGEEFILLMPEIEAGAAEKFAQKLRSGIEMHSFGDEACKAATGITLSIGIAEWRAGATAPQLIAEADSAMYAAKEAGRNRVCVYSDGFLQMAGTKVKRIQDMAFASQSIRQIIETLESDANQRVFSSDVTILASFLKVLLTRESDTAEHCLLVNKLSLMLGKKCGLAEKELLQLNWGSILHDIGKLAISDSLLLKRDKLTPSEYATLKKHSEIGYELLKHNAYINSGGKVILHHHERWDGKGYPAGLAAEGIPLLARICSLADSIAAMATARPYREAMTRSFILEELRRHAGRQFDPDLARIAESVVEELFHGEEYCREDWVPQEWRAAYHGLKPGHVAAEKTSNGMM